MAKKVNPFLAQFEAQLNETYRQKLEINSQLDYIALLLLLHENFKVGPGRGDKNFKDFLAWKVELAETILEDSKDDRDIIKTKHDMAANVKEILGPQGWEESKVMFPLLREYW